ERLGALEGTATKGAQLNALASDGPERDRLVRPLARSLVELRVRGVDVPSLLTKSYADLLDATTGRQAAATVKSRLRVLRVKAGDDREALGQGWRCAALLALALHDEAARDAFDQHVTRAFDVRQHLRIRSLQGGELLDFSGAPPARRRIPSSEVLGTGL